MNTLLWVCQIVLALVFLLSGTLKSVKSKQWLVASGQTGVAELPLSQIRFIAACEILGAVGLIVPWALHIVPLLAPLAAACLGAIMILAGRVHLRLHEPKNVATNAVLLAICVTVVYGRATQLWQ